MGRSVSHFLASITPIQSADADPAPIDLGRRIQSLGAMLVVDRVSRVVKACTGNAAAVIGLDGEDLLGHPLDTLPAEIRDDVEDGVVLGGPKHRLIGERTSPDQMVLEMIAHVQGDDHVIEFVPARPSDTPQLQATTRSILRRCADIQRAQTILAASQAATDAVTEITGFDRVTVCAFASNQTGQILAETRTGAGLPSLLGKSFLIPGDQTRPVERARAIPYRAIHSVKNGTRPIQTLDPNASTLDLSSSVLRPVAPAHAAYLTGLGIGAAFAVVLELNEKPWGLIICHHRDPLWLSLSDWELIRDIGAGLMARVDLARTKSLNDRRLTVRAIESGLTSTLRSLGQIDEAMTAVAPALQATLAADGFAIVLGKKTFVSGRTPPVDFIRTLPAWANSQPEHGGQFHTRRLHGRLADAKGHKDTACGVLIQQIDTHPDCHLLWFRRPDQKPTLWIDGPDTGSFPGEDSKPWDLDDTAISKEIFAETLDIVAGHLALHEENKDLKAITTQLIQQQEHHALRNFVASAVHDLKAPLRAIKFALEMMKEEHFDPDAVADAYRIAETSGDRMVALTDSILTLADVQSTALEAEPIEMLSLLEDVRAVLSADFSLAEARLDLRALPMLYGDRDQIARLFENLVSNAIKYRSPDRAPVISIDGQINDGWIVYVVSDNGMGIDEHAAAEIFKPMVRLHAKDHIEGVGLGLTICQGIVEVHGGTIRCAPADPHGLQVIIELPIFPPT